MADEVLYLEEHLSTILFRMLYTMENQPLPMSFPSFLMELHFTKEKQMSPPKGSREFRRCHFPKEGSCRTERELRKLLSLCMICLFKANYQQKRRQYPKAAERKSSVSKLFQNSHYLHTWQRRHSELYHTVHF